MKLANGEWVPLENREPEAEYRVLRDQWAVTQKEGSRDQSGRIVGQPIDQAMQKVLEGQGLPSRTKTIPEGGPGGRAEDYGIDAPTAASSGRATARRGQ